MERPHMAQNVSCEINLSSGLRVQDTGQLQFNIPSTQARFWIDFNEILGRLAVKKTTRLEPQNEDFFSRVPGQPQMFTQDQVFS